MSFSEIRKFLIKRLSL